LKAKGKAILVLKKLKRFKLSIELQHNAVDLNQIVLHAEYFSHITLLSNNTE